MAITPSGKDKLLRNTRIYVGAHDLSGDARTFGSLLNSVADVERTSWNEDMKNFISDEQRMIGIDGFQAIMNDAANRSHAQLKDIDATVIGVMFGGGGEPAIGDPAYLLRSVAISGLFGLDAGIEVINADFRPDAGQLDSDIFQPLGVVLHNAALTATTSSELTVDEGAQTTKGGSAILFIPVSSGGTWAFKIQDSSDDSSFADLITFTSDGSAVTTETADDSGTVDRYMKFVATRTSGTVTPVCLWARNF